MPNPLDTVLAYHQRTKHHFQRYAAGPHGLDWANQPDPFRTYAGAPRLDLPLMAQDPETRFADLDRTGSIPARPLTLENLAALLELALGLSAWKQHEGTRWALRCNPSSGNLHPTEAYVLSAGIGGIENGVHHYLSRDHCLEQRCRFSLHAATTLSAGVFLLGLTSIHWREAWKYGERAFRYCQHDVGHAIAALRYSASLLGWEVRLLAEWGDADMASLLGTDRDADFGPAEREHPDVMLVVSTGPLAAGATPAPQALLNAAPLGTWQGRANPLSVEHGHEWPVIDEVDQASAKPATLDTPWQAPLLPRPLDCDCLLTAAEIIRQRRSAQAFDGETSMSTACFYRLLDMTLPRGNTVPWDTVSWQPRLHLLLFVHRVEGLAPGLYLFLRHPEAEPVMRSAITAEFEWTPVTGCPAHFRLYRLVSADARNAARALSCHQDIAADSAFSLAMLAEYDAALQEGPWAYRRLFWEAGMVGQVLYLEAEAAGVRGTGIGCFFDDGVHDLLGLQGTALQDLYHFTVGGPLTDTRLQTLPPYGHLKGR
jgi:SagB-type dehydrogenase family enzyme